MTSAPSETTETASSVSVRAIDAGLAVGWIGCRLGQRE